MPNDQLILDFSSPSAERKACLKTACRYLGLALHHWTLLELIERVAGGAEFRRTHAELAEELWCSVDTVQRVLIDLQELGLVDWDHERDRHGHQDANVYWISFERVRALVAEAIRTGGLTRKRSRRRPARPVAPEPQIAVHPPQIAVHPPQIAVHPPQIAVHTYKEVLPYDSLLTPKPPPPPPSLPKGPSAQVTVAAPWEEVEEELLALGMAQAPTCAAALRARGCGLDLVRQTLQVFRARSHQWKSPVGALFRRLEVLRPGQDPQTLWPPPSPADARRIQSAEADQRRARAREESALAVAQQQRQAATIAAWNERLERLDEPALRALAGQIEAIGDLARTSSPRDLRKLFRAELCQRLEEMANE